MQLIIKPQNVNFTHAHYIFGGETTSTCWTEAGHTVHGLVPHKIAWHHLREKGMSCSVRATQTSRTFLCITTQAAFTRRQTPANLEQSLYRDRSLNQTLSQD